MAICNTCRSIRVGANGGGDTLMEALGAVESIMRMGHAAVAYGAVDSIIQHGRANGICYSCISELQALKNELGKYI